MANKEHISATLATQFLRNQGLAFSEQPCAYEEKGGVKVSARELGVPEHVGPVSSLHMDSKELPALMCLHDDSLEFIGREVLEARCDCFCRCATPVNRQKKRRRYWR